MRYRLVKEEMPDHYTRYFTEYLHENGSWIYVTNSLFLDEGLARLRYEDIKAGKSELPRQEILEESANV